MNVTPVFPGTYYVSNGKDALLAGCPPEIVKVLMHRGFGSPGNILLPDQAVAQGESQISVEFPLYHHWFFGKHSGPVPPLTLIGSDRRVTAAMEMLQLTLFGPTAQKMVEWGLTEAQAAAMIAETGWFHVKGKDGNAIPLESMARGVSLETEPVDLGWVRLKRVRFNVFELSWDGGSQTIDLTLTEEQAPPYPVTPDLTPSTLVKLGVEVLGGSTGFSTTQASSGMALCHNGNYMLIDAIPYLNYHLRARGIARNQINSIFVSHIHDDHCNVLPLLHYNRRMHVLTTPLIFRMLLRKLSLLLDRSEESMREYFHFHPLTPGGETDYYGLRVKPFWSSHSIPTIGAYFETTHEGHLYRVIFSGDTQSLADVKRMQQAGVVPEGRYEEIAQVFATPAQLLLADGGEGAIHGDPADAAGSPAERIVFLHLDKLSDRFATHFTIASSGKRFTVLRGETNYQLTHTIEHLLDYFPNMPSFWISHLLSSQRSLAFNSGDIIIRQGARSEGFVYMILTGYAQVVHHDGTRKHNLATMEAGELIGEMSILTGEGQRNASVVACSPVVVTAIAEDSFREYIKDQNLGGQLKTMWQNRQLLQTLPYLKSLQQPVIRELSRRVTLENLPLRHEPTPLRDVCEPFGLILPLGAELTIRRGQRTEVVHPRQSPIMCQAGELLETEAEFQYFRLSADMARELRQTIPAFRFFWEETLGLPIPVKVGD